MPVLRSRHAATAAPVLADVLDRLAGASGSEIREAFLAIRRFYADDASNITAFWLDRSVVQYDPIRVSSHRQILMWLFDFTGLRHPLVRAYLHTLDKSTLACVGVIKTVRKTEEGDEDVVYKYKLGEAI
jgi:hypothetical protein